MAEPLTILCVDDEETPLAIRKLVFESAGYAVLTAGSGESALEVFRSEKIKLAVIDYSMTGMNGLELAREMKLLNPQVPILMLSGHASLPQEAHSIADATIQKAGDPRQLLELATELIGQSM